MHRVSQKSAFRRLVLVNEDVYKRAVQCMEEDAVARMSERTVWYEKSGPEGVVRRDYNHGDVDNVRSANPLLTVRETSPPIPTAPAFSPPASVLPTVLFSPNTAEQPVRHVSESESAPEMVREQESSELILPTSNRKDVPAIHRNKYDALFRKLRKSGMFHVDSSGNLAIGDTAPIPGTNFHKLMRSMFVSSFSSDNTAGRREFLNALKGAGIRASEVSAQSARSALAVQAGSGKFVKRRAGPPGCRVNILRVY